MKTISGKPTGGANHPGKGRRKAAPRAPAVVLTLEEDEFFSRHRGPLMALFGWFFLQHMIDLYREFEGDLVTPIILGEIAHHNICHHYSRGRKKKGIKGGSPKGATPWDHLEPCNALSVSDASGIPRETCRRKVRELQQQGFIRRHPQGGYIVCRDISQRFLELNRRTFSRYLIFRDEFDAFTSAPKR